MPHGAEMQSGRTVMFRRFGLFIRSNRCVGRISADNENVRIPEHPPEFKRSRPGVAQAHASRQSHARK